MHRLIYSANHYNNRNKKIFDDVRKKQDHIYSISREKVKDIQVKCNGNKQLNCDNLMQLKKHAKSNIRKRDASVFTKLQNV